MTDVLLTHSYHLFFDRKQVRKMRPYPPLGTLYAAALLRQRGLSVALFDSMLEDPETGFPQALTRHNPRVVVVYEDNFNFLTKMCLTRMREVAFSLLDKSKAAGAVTIANGSDATDHLPDYLRRGFDYLLVGEAEWTLLELAQRILGVSSEPASAIAGLAYLDTTGQEIVRTPPRNLMPSLDALPFPAWDLVDAESYRAAWTQAHGYFSLNMVSSRGCPYHCNWCAKPIYGTSYNARSPERVAEEMRFLKERFKPDHLWFADDIFALKPHWTERFTHAVRELEATIPFQMQSRVDLMTPAMARHLAEAGCGEVWMGAESGSQRILDAMEKGSHVEQILQARQNLKSAGIRACFFLQFGYPGETWEDIQMTIDLVRRARPDDIGISVSYPLPGTKFHTLVREQLESKTNWEDSEDLAMMFRGTYTDEFYRALHDALHLEVDLCCLQERHSAFEGPRSKVQRPRFGETASPANEPGSDKSSKLSSVQSLTERRQELMKLWNRVNELEISCRNTNPTQLGVRGPESGFRSLES
jgi:anaerobic magnesium-protoporphyrin IX monomethyl ester cyclase